MKHLRCIAVTPTCLGKTVLFRFLEPRWNPLNCRAVPLGTLLYFWAGTKSLSRRDDDEPCCAGGVTGEYAFWGISQLSWSSKMTRQCRASLRTPSRMVVSSRQLPHLEAVTLLNG